MQDRYAGDIGDFGKFGLLKFLAAENLCVGINWYKAEPPKSEMNSEGAFLQNDGKHKIKAKYFPCDEELARTLLEISEHKDRSISMLQNASLLPPSVVYYGAVVMKEQRQQWHADALKAVAACDVVFLDPDNGLIVKSVGKKSAKSVKYVFEEELRDYLSNGKSVVLYNHRPRRKPEVYFGEMAERFSKIDPLRGAYIFPITFSKGSTRDYFMIAANSDHAVRMRTAAEKMTKGLWGNMGLCRLPMD